MNKTTQTNLDRLQIEVFSGSDLEWKVSQKQGPDKLYVENNQAWYWNKKGTDIIYVQPKSPEDAPAYCYGCRKNILVMLQQVTDWAADGPGPCAGVDVRTNYIQYCPKCESVPQATNIAINSDEELVGELYQR